ncbi:Rap guanine nucleotide exchange factor 5 [Takifugu flavidus]|uniref:Rap guanine nucleotide exchange factor 5 n=1 Tax=Takifugu flavidus TaxID=433684 RepID=A0A5C6NE28_9TELE|nr:Rap guanine nucleotide exchange factor 5 [Takifugu flavidus]
MEDSEPAEDGLLAGLRWNRSARDQVQLKHKIRDLPGLLKHGLHLRKKSQSPDTIPGPSAGPTVHKSFPCAGRSVRNAFLSHGPYPAKDKIHLARIIRRSYVGVELVQWLCEQCVYVRCRTTAVRVWQVLLELGVLLSVDQRVVFSDSNTYYQFSFEECDSPSCEFRSNEGEWPEAVRLLLQLAPYVQFRSGGGANSPSEEDSEGNRDICSEMLQMKALERLTSTVQSELAAALARKTRKALSEQDSETMETSQQEPRTPSEESSPLSGVCTLRGGGGGGGIGTCNREELTSRLGLETVQRLAKDGCRLLQNHNHRLSDKNQAEALGRVCLKERGRDVLVLQRVKSSVTSPSDRPSPTSSGGGSREDDCDKRCFDMKMTSRATLAEVEEDVESEDEDDGEGQGSDSEEGVSSSEVCTFDVPYFRYIDEDVEEGRDKGILNECNRSWPSCSTEKDRRASSPHRYVVVSGTPLKILEHLLSDLRLDDQRGAPESRESEMLLDDFLLTYLVFMTTHDLCQALLGQYPY